MLFAVSPSLDFQGEVSQQHRRWVDFASDICTDSVDCARRFPVARALMNVGEPYRAACSLSPAAARIAAHILYSAADLPIDWRYLLHGALYARGGERGPSLRDRVAVVAYRWPRTRFVTYGLAHSALIQAFDFVHQVQVAAHAPDPVSWWQVALGGSRPTASTSGRPRKRPR